MKPWIKSIFLMEVKNILTYRFEFWMNFLGGTAANFLIAYFLWNFIFEAQGLTTLNGYSIQGMTLYYLIAPLTLRVMDADSMGFISREVYDGSLNKYLIYPVEIFIYKWISYMVRGCFYLLQLFVLLGFFLLIVGAPKEFSITPTSIGIFLGFATLIMVVYFFMVASIEMISFWADNIWSLRVFVFLLVSFLGGSAIPLSFFPEWSMPILKILPFRSMVYLPTQFLLGKHFELIGEALLTLSLWGIGFCLALNFLWKKGMKQYTGVGM